MKFMRRPDIDTVARVHIAVQAFLGLGVYGEITRIAIAIGSHGCLSINCSGSC